MKSPVTLKERVFLCNQMVGMIFILKSIPSSTMFFVLIIFNHSITEYWILYESNMSSLEILFLASFFNWLVVWYSLSLGYILCLSAFDHIDIHEVVFSWWRIQERKEGPSYIWRNFDEEREYRPSFILHPNNWVLTLLNWNSYPHSTDWNKRMTSQNAQCSNRNGFRIFKIFCKIGVLKQSHAPLFGIISQMTILFVNHMCDECKKSIEIIVCHKSWSI